MKSLIWKSSIHSNILNQFHIRKKSWEQTFRASKNNVLVITILKDKTQKVFTKLHEKPDDV